MSRQSAGALINQAAVTSEHPTLNQVEAALGRVLTAAEYVHFANPLSGEEQPQAGAEPKAETE